GAVLEAVADAGDAGGDGDGLQADAAAEGDDPLNRGAEGDVGQGPAVAEAVASRIDVSLTEGNGGQPGAVHKGILAEGLYAAGDVQAGDTGGLEGLPSNGLQPLGQGQGGDALT